MYERLGNICSIARGGSPRPIENYLTDDENGLNWIKIGDTEQGGKYIYSTKEKIRPEGLSKTRYVCSGDFLLTNSMSFGRPYILRTNGCIHDGWLVIGGIEIAFHQDYLYYMLSSSIMYNALSSLNVLPKCGGLFPLHIRHFRRTVFSVRNPNQKQILIIKENIFELNELITVIITYYK